jgi:mannose-6-phosphate isomerase
MSDVLAGVREQTVGGEWRMATAGPGFEIKRIAAEARDWLFDAALPLWSTIGHDDIHGGFFEQIDLETHQPIHLPKRCRVQARQTYVFCEAGRLGWRGPWEACARSGLDFMLRHHLRPNGLMRFTTTREGAVRDDSVDNYDQAFAIFGLAHAQGQALDTDAARIARNLLGSLRRERSHPPGGFSEGIASRAPCLANPHMHFFEAALAWLDIAPAPAWRDLAGEIAQLCVARLIDPKSGALREYFEADWTPRADDDGRIVEPGHQFEWASLLLCWREHGGEVNLAAPRRLYAFAEETGLDATADFAISEVLIDGGVRDAGARLWPQTERLKAAIRFARCCPEEKSRFESDAVRAWRGLRRFIDTAPPGLFRDKRKPDGTFAPEGALASSLYHIVGGVSELIRYAETVAPA